MSYHYLAIHPTAGAFLPCRHPDWAVDVIKVKHIFQYKSLRLHLSYNGPFGLCAPCEVQNSLSAVLE